MKSILKKSLVAAALVAAVSVTGAPDKASAQVTDACKAQSAGALSVSGTTVSGQFTIPAGCPPQVVSLMVFKTTANIAPLSTQKMHSYSSAGYPAGTHTISTSLPAEDCFYQADLFRSGPVLQLQDIDYSSTLMAFKLGGSKDCLVVPPTVTPTTPEVPATPVAAAAVTPAIPVEEAKATVLPNTGPGTIVAGAVGVAMTSGLGYNFIARRRAS